MADWQERLITALGGDTPSGNTDWQDRILALLNDASTETDPGGHWTDRVVGLLGGATTDIELDWQERIIVAAGGTAYSAGNWQDRMVDAFTAWASTEE